MASTKLQTNQCSSLTCRITTLQKASMYSTTCPRRTWSLQQLRSSLTRTGRPSSKLALRLSLLVSFGSSNLASRRIKVMVFESSTTWRRFASICRSFAVMLKIDVGKAAIATASFSDTSWSHCWSIEESLIFASMLSSHAMLIQGSSVATSMRKDTFAHRARTSISTSGTIGWYISRMTLCRKTQPTMASTSPRTRSATMTSTSTYLRRKMSAFWPRSCLRSKTWSQMYLRRLVALCIGHRSCVKVSAAASKLSITMALSSSVLTSCSTIA